MTNVHHKTGKMDHSDGNTNTIVPLPETANLPTLDKTVKSMGVP